MIVKEELPYSQILHSSISIAKLAAALIRCHQGVYIGVYIMSLVPWKCELCSQAICL